MRRFTAVLVCAVLLLGGTLALAGNPDLQAKVAALKQAIANNQQMLAQYTWQQQETISVKGDVKQQQQYQVQLGPNGKPQKALESVPPPKGRPHGIKHIITSDYQQYGQQIAALAQSYAQPDPGKLQQLYQQGNVMLGSAGAPGMVALVVQNYVKQGDKVTIVFNQAQKAIQSINVATYLSGPSDAVTVAAQFGQLGDGTNYVSTMTVNGSSKSLTVQQANSDFQKR